MSATSNMVEVLEQKNMIDENEVEANSSLWGKVQVALGVALTGGVSSAVAGPITEQTSFTLPTGIDTTDAGAVAALVLIGLIALWPLRRILGLAK